MKRRAALLKSVTIAFFLLAGGFLFILFSSLGTKPKKSEIDGLQELDEGQTIVRRVSGKRLWITRLSTLQRERLLPDHSCKKSVFCAIPAATDVTGIELVFSLTKPTQLGPTQAWHGGFINPTNGAVYNLGGSAYKLKHANHASDLVPVFID